MTNTINNNPPKPAPNPIANVFSESDSVAALIVVLDVTLVVTDGVVAEVTGSVSIVDSSGMRQSEGK